MARFQTSSFSCGLTISSSSCHLSLVTCHARNGRAGGAPAEDAAAEERAFERTQSVNAAAAKPGGFAHRVKTGQRLAVESEHARLQISLNAAETFARQYEFTNGDQRARFRIINLRKLAGAYAVAAVLARVRDAAQLVV